MNKIERKKTRIAELYVRDGVFRTPLRGPEIVLNCTYAIALQPSLTPKQH